MLNLKFKTSIQNNYVNKLFTRGKAIAKHSNVLVTIEWGSFKTGCFFFQILFYLPFLIQQVLISYLFYT